MDEWHGRVRVGFVLAGLAVGLSSCGWAEWSGPVRTPVAPAGGGAAAAPSETERYQVQRPPVRVDTLPDLPAIKPDPEAPLAATPPSGAPSPATKARAASPATVVVTAEAGDTVYALSRRYRVPTRTIIETNRLEPPYRLVVGQRIVLPQRRDHIVSTGETLYSLSRMYGVDLPLLASANGLVAPYSIRAGQAIRIPDTANLPPPAAPPLASGDTLPVRAQSGVEPPAPTTLPAITGAGFAWPVEGRVISGFGPKPRGLHNDGINISAPRGTPVLAAENGVVAYAGNELRGFGNLILVRHDAGWVTAYAHNDALLVKRGDVVRRGQEIARLGSSGNVSSPQLHFQLRRGKTPVDPAQHLTRGS